LDSYRKISGAVFALVAIGHGARAAAGLPVTIGTTSVPVWISWVFCLASAVLSVWAMRARR
jgi:membrane protein implicated in regulation of membrane protease activity